MAEAVHILIEFRSLFQRLGDRREAIVQSLYLIGAPCLLTSLTTAVGFLALQVSPILAIAHMAVYSAVGVVLAFALTMMLVPALVSFGPRMPSARNAARDSAHGGAWLLRGLRAVAAWNVRHRRAVLVGFAATAVLSMIGIARLRVDSNWLDDFSDRVPLKAATSRIDQVMGGMANLVYVFDTGAEDGIRDPAVLRAIESLQREAERDPLVRKAYSIADIVKDLNQSFHDGDPAYYAIPDSRELVSQLLLLYETSGGDQVEEWATTDFARANLELRLGIAPVSHTARFVENLGRYLAAHPTPGIEVKLTGIGALWLELLHYIVASEIESFLFAFALIGAMMCFIFRSFRTGLLSMVPNVWPILLTLGGMGWSGIPLDYNKVMIATVAMGIAVDDTIHFVSRYHHEFEESGSYAEALAADDRRRPCGVRHLAGAGARLPRQPVLRAGRGCAVGRAAGGNDRHGTARRSPAHARARAHARAVRARGRARAPRRARGGRVRRAAAAIGSAAAFGALWLVCGVAPTGEPPAPRAVEVAPGGVHRVWITDRIWRHSALFDGDTGQVLGMVDGPGVTVTPKLPLHAHRRGEIYVAELAYSRGSRGERTDFITIYDDRTLTVTGEVVLPTRTGDANTSIGYEALLDGERFLATFNQFPFASVSITDLEKRMFASEVLITGCAGIFPTGERSFATLCGDGTVAAVELDAEGHGHVSAHSERFFDPVSDPVTMAGVRWGSRWVFVSFEGFAHVIDFASGTPVAAPSWSLFTDTERNDRWRVGGFQHLALHAASQRLYSIVHRGGPGSHKAPGREVWVYDLAERRRVERFALPHFMAAYAAPQFGITRGSWLHRILQHWIPSDGAHSLAVTQDAAPLLFVRNAEVGVVAVLDARTGEHLRNLDDAGVAGPTMGVDP